VVSGMHKKVLSELNFYYGDVKMPKGFEIDRISLAIDIFKSEICQMDFNFSRPFDMLNRYIIEYFQLNFKKAIFNTSCFGNIYYPNESSFPILKSKDCDYVMLYCIKIEPDSCFLRMFYDDNNNKDNWWDIPLKDNKFILIPSSLNYFISHNESNDMNIILTIKYESK
tara:strand:+ start:441 stop:944 length:504 start_codon:yes stop_codon:yes gene_type:complete